MKTCLFRSGLALLVVTLTACAVPAQDQTPDGQAAKEADVRRLIELTSPDSMLVAMLDQTIAQFSSVYEHFPPDFWQKFRDRVDYQALKDHIVSIYDTCFTHDEIRELIAFYSTPLGQKVLQVGPIVREEALAFGVRMGRKLAADILAEKESTNPDWTRYVSEDSSYSVLFPVAPTETMEPLGMLDASVDVHSSRVTLGNCAYFISYIDFPEDSTPIDSRQMLWSIGDDAAARMDGEVVADTAILLSDYPGREMTIIAADGGSIYRIRLYMVDRRMYELVSVTPISEFYTSQAIKFFHSFQLLSTQADAQ
jgi:hypothetical protein